MTTTDPWASTDMPPDLPSQYHFSHGVTGIGRCASCNELRTMFVHSAIHDADDCEPLCATCVCLRIETLFRTARGAGDDYLKDMYYAIYHDWASASVGYQHSRQEVMAHPQGCQACARFMDRYMVTAVDRDNPTNKATVHADCAVSCDHCETYFFSRYGSSHMNNYRYGNLTGRIATDGQAHRVCASCLEIALQADPTLQQCSCQMYEEAGRLTYYDFLGEDVCRYCSSNIIECDRCGEECWADGDHECSESSVVIKSWDFRPTGGFTFHGEDPNRTYMGFELEVEACDAGLYENACWVSEKLDAGNRGFLKSDGSLDDGFEIVTQPHTLAEYMEKFPWSIMPDLREAGFRSWDTDTCGFHVHVSREAFGWKHRGEFNEGKYHAHLLRFTKLIYDNQRQVTRFVAGRSSQRWAAYTDKGRLTEKIKTGYQSNSRYSAVNVSNTHTIEVRVFKGSLIVPRLKSYLQFVHSVTEYTRDLHVSPNENNLMWRKYTGWLHKNEQTYPELVSLITTRTEQGED